MEYLELCNQFRQSYVTLIISDFLREYRDSIIRMFIPLLFAVSFTVYGVAGISPLKDSRIPCYFGTYDLNGDSEISPEEFLSATRGFTKMDPKTLFERLDTNGDKTISVDEFTHVDPSLGDEGIIPRCRRRWCLTIKIGCVTITISTDRPRTTPAEP